MRKSKLLWIMYLVLIVFSTAVSANNITYNYVFNGSSWVPWLATSDGRPKVDLNLVNITAGSIAVSENASIAGNISLGDKIVFAYGESIDNIKDGIITITGNLNVTGDTYLNSMIFEQGNITASHGLFETLNVTGTGYLNTMSFESGNVTASYFIGDGSLLSGISNNSINYGWNGSELVPFKLSSDGILQMSINNDIADGLGCTDCIGETEILDVYVLNSGDIINGNLEVVGNINASGLNITGTIIAATLNVTGTSYLGSMTLEGGNITASLGTFATLNVTGAAYLGNVTIESGNITPVANNTYSLGSPTLWWRDLYVGNNSLYIAGTALSATADGILKWNGTVISNVAVQTGNNTVLGAAVNENVGIGTSSPTSKLDVAGTVNATQFTINGSDLYSLFAELTDKIGNTTAEIRAQFSSSDNVSISSGVISINKSFVLSTDKLGNTTEEIWFVIDNETFARLIGFSGENITSGSVADTYVTDDLTIASTKTINTTGGLNVSGGAYISGNVGVGISTPQKELHVIGSANITGTVYAHNFSGNSNISFLNASGDEIVRFTDTGRVGIGMMTPNNTVHIYKSSDTQTASLVLEGWNAAKSGGRQWELRTPDAASAAPTGYFAIRDNGANTNRLVIDLSGNVGIGTVGPQQEIDIYASSAPGIRLSTASHWGEIEEYLAEPGNNGGGLLFKARNGATGASDTIMAIRGSGGVGINTTSPVLKLDVRGTATAPSSSGSVNSGAIWVGSTGGATNTFGMSIGVNDSSPYYGWLQSHFNDNAGVFGSLILQPLGGNVGIGDTTPTEAKLVVSGTVFVGDLTAPGNDPMCWDGVTNDGTIGDCSSLRELKTNFQPFSLGLDDLMKIQSKHFDWKNGRANDSGFIAEEMEEVSPWLVNYREGNLTGINTHAVDSLLVKSVQEQQEQIQQIKSEKDAEIESLKSQNQALKQQNEQIQLENQEIKQSNENLNNSLDLLTQRISALELKQ